MLPAVLAALSAVAAAGESSIPDDVWLYRDREVLSVRVEGLDEATAERLRGGLALAAKGARFYPSVLEEDLVRARLFLARHGHADPRIRVAARPKREDEVVVVLTVESRPIAVESVRIEGTPPGFERTEHELVAALAGRPFTDRSVDSVGVALRDELRVRGWLLAEVDAVVERAPEGGAGVTLAARPGSVQYWGDTLVEGAAADLAPLAARVTDLPRGRRSSSKDLERAQENLRLLGLFGRIRLSSEPAAPETLDVRIEVGERRPRSVKTGIGYWTDEGIRGGAQWTHRNFFRGGRALDVGAVASQYQQDGFVSTRWPALFAPSIWTELRLSAQNASEENYDQLEGRASFANRWWFSSRKSFLLDFATSRVKVDGRLPDFDEERDDLLVALAGDLEFDGSDDVIRPTRGRKLTLGAEWAPARVSESEYVIGAIEGVHYFRPPRATLLTARAFVGAAKRLGATESLLPDRRFYSGGASSQRGFERRKLGPLDADGNPVGGEAVLNASLDLRFPIFRALKGAAFVDAGQVWFRTEDVRLGDVEVAVGPGLWVDTAVGPFRFDVGFRVTDVSPAPREAYHVAIGTPF
jgi:outer membrane protein assembly factor BamA